MFLLAAALTKAEYKVSVPSTRGGNEQPNDWLAAAHSGCGGKGQAGEEAGGENAAQPSPGASSGSRAMQQEEAPLAGDSGQRPLRSQNADVSSRKVCCIPSLLPSDPSDLTRSEKPMQR